MLGDGKTEYDQAHDGEANAIGQCEVRFLQYTRHTGAYMWM